MNEKVATEEFRCEHCNRTFVKSGTLLKHLCEPKRRWMDRDRPSNRIAYLAWSKFYQQYQPRSKKKEYRDFSSSAYYGAFVKFGSYCVDVSVVNPLMYSDWLLKEKVSVDNWANDRHYGRYLIEYTRLEDGMDAVKRSVETLLKFSEEDNLQLGDVLKFTNANKLCHKIVSGKISPWLLFNSDSGRDFLSTLNSGQTEMIFEYINPDIWNIKFKRDSETVSNVRDLLKQAGI
jgi:hypothetical protein